MKELTKLSRLSVGEIVWALVTIGSLIALFRCLARWIPWHVAKTDAWHPRHL